jgi:hypothetical protein
MKTSLSKKKGNHYQGKKVTLNKPFYTSRRAEEECCLR